MYPWHACAITACSECAGYNLIDLTWPWYTCQYHHSVWMFYGCLKVTRKAYYLANVYYDGYTSLFYFCIMINLNTRPPPIEREREMFYLTTHSTHFINGYMASDIWLRTILIVRKETRCRHIGYSYRLTAMVLLYAPSHRQDNTYRGRYTPVVEHWLERSTNWCQTRVGQMLLILVEFSHIFDLTTVTIQKD